MTAVVLLDRMDGADVGVIEGRSGARLALKALEQLAVLGHFGRKKLQSHVAAELRILGFINNAHAARAQLSENLVMQERLADQPILVHVCKLIVLSAGVAVKEAGRPRKKNGDFRNSPLAPHGFASSGQPLSVQARPNALGKVDTS